MSLLLDALKKAAQEKLEKQNHDGQSEADNPALADFGENNLSAVEDDKDEPAPAGFSGNQADHDEALELEPLEDDELSIDPDSLAEVSDTDYRFRRSQVLASELRAFNSDTHRQATGGVGDTEWSLEPARTLYPPTPQQAAQVFSNKQPGHNRPGTVLLVGTVLLTVLSAGGMFAYKYLADTNDDFQVVMSGPAPEPAGADVNVDSSLLIEQEDYDSLLAEELDNATRATASDAATAQPVEQDEDYSLSTTATETKEATAGNAPTPRRSAFDKGGLSIRRNQDKEPLQNILMRGYTAYNNGDFESAEIAYRQALTRAPDSRDAMLGMAAVHYVRGDTAAAAAYYRKLLQRDPKDELALAALAGIEDAAQSSLTPEESRIKLLLAEKPDSGYLLFTLGNIYAGERRWAEAQQAYFDAHRLEPENPDYAFNLAVSLDHLGKKKAAAGYYRQSLTLARDRKANFDTRIAVDRLDNLQEF